VVGEAALSFVGVLKDLLQLRGMVITSSIFTGAHRVADDWSGVGVDESELDHVGGAGGSR